MNVRVLRQIEVEPPGVFAEAMPPDLFQRLRLVPVPVRFLNQQKAEEGDWQWGGFCPGNAYTECGEVTIDARLVEGGEWTPVIERIQSVYLHEVAHRLMPGQSHNAAFHALMLVLYLRAGETNGRPLWHFSKLYDWQDEADLPRAFAWAWRVAHELAATEHTAERCAEIITQRYQAWRDWITGEADRLQARRDAEQTAKTAHTALLERVGQLKLDRWLWAAVAAVVGMTVALLVR